MKMPEPVRRVLLFAIVAAICIALFVRARAPLAAQVTDQDEEVQMGQEVFNELKAKGEIVEDLLAHLHFQIGRAHV